MSMEGNADCDSVQMTTHADKYLLAWEQEHRIAAERWRNQARAGENSFHFPMVSPLRKEVRSTGPRSCGEDAALAESDERPQQLTSPLLPRSLPQNSLRSGQYRARRRCEHGRRTRTPRPSSTRRRRCRRSPPRSWPSSRTPRRAPSPPSCCLEAE